MRHQYSTASDVRQRRASAFAQAAAAWIFGLPAALAGWQRIRRDERYLLEQTDARLADIGLDRREIGRALRGDPRR